MERNMRIELPGGKIMYLPCTPSGTVAKSAGIYQPSRAEILAYVKAQAKKAAKRAAKVLIAEQKKADKKAAKAAAKARAARAGSVRKSGRSASDLSGVMAEMEATRASLNLLEAERRFRSARGSVEKGAAGQALTLARLAAFNRGEF